MAHDALPDYEIQQYYLPSLSTTPAPPESSRMGFASEAWPTNQQVESQTIMDSSTSLMCLPAELRTKILKNLLIFEDTLDFAFFARHYRNSWSRFDDYLWAILHVCKEFWIEGIKIIYSCNAISLVVTSNSYLTNLAGQGWLDSEMYFPLPNRPPVFDRRFCVRHAIKRLEICVEVSSFKPLRHRIGEMRGYHPEIEKLRGKLRVFEALGRYGFDNLQVVTLTLHSRAGTWLWGRYPGYVGNELLSADEISRRKSFLKILVDSLINVGPVKTKEFRFRVGESVDEEARVMVEKALQIHDA